MNDTRSLRDLVLKAYSSAAQRPTGKHPFPVGRRFAESLGYSQGLLDRMPSVSVDAFSGVSNLFGFAEIPPGATVLDLGCGAGMDSLIAAQRAGARGRVIGIDFSAAMLIRGREALAETGLATVQFLRASAEDLPLRDGSVDVALINGLFNLNPAREAIFGELARVVRREGRLYAAELILKDPLPSTFRVTEGNWLSWIAGAKEGGAFLDEFRSAGFREAIILRTVRNARTKSKRVVAAEVAARR